MKGTLWIGGYAWSVQVVTSPLWHQGRAVHGTTDGHEMQIRVSRRGSCDLKVRSSLVHELLHAALETVNNGYPDDEEQAVQALEVGLFSALTDSRNEWFWRAVRGESRPKRRVRSI